jgi:AsmA-like C-terminal region
MSFPLSFPPPPLASVRAKTPNNPGRSHRWYWIIGVLLVIGIGLAIWVRIEIARAQPILRAKIVETLSARFKSRVDLGDLYVWIDDGLHVEGKELKIFGVTDPNPWEPGVQPLIEIGTFQFHSTVRSLFREPMHVGTVYVRGLTLNIPPKGDRQQMINLHQRLAKTRLVVEQFICTDAKLIINTAKPGKPPLEFDIKTLRMKGVGPGQTMPFEATLVNPKPQGDIKSTGTFGPLKEENVRDTAVKGSYSFTNANLGTLNGISGILSSDGKYSGVLGRIAVEGETDTPDFSLEISGHRVPLHTQFHAIVDGTDGDTYLDPVKAKILRSSFTARGKVVRMKNAPGHDIELQIVLDRAFIEDLLKLGVKTDPAVMTGPIDMRASLSLMPGEGDIAGRLKLAGNFHIREGHFTNEKVQGRIDSLSLRSRGEARLAQEHYEENVPSDLQGTFKLEQGILSFSDLQFIIPGTHADLTGQYSLNGKTFDFRGNLELKAKLSQMTTGWKSLLLKPADPFFQKHGAGTEVPFRITGTRDQPHFGLDYHL